MQPTENEIMQIIKELAHIVEGGKDGIQIIAISIFAGITRTIMSEDKRNIGAFVLSCFTAGFVGYMAHLSLVGSDFSPSTVGVITGIAAFSATDLLKGVMKVTSAFANDPHKAVRDIFATWKGRK